MISLFTTPRKFAPPYDVIQGNAFRSWSMIEPRPEVTIFADYDHEGEAACDVKEYGFYRATVLKRSPRGVPLMSDLFPRAQSLAGKIGAGLDQPCFESRSLRSSNDSGFCTIKSQ